MQGRLILVSDDSDFFEYIESKLILRSCDELYKIKFKDFHEHISLIKTAVLLINSENKKNETLELLKIASGIPSIVFAYNQEESFTTTVFQSGAITFITPVTPDEEIQAIISSAFNITSLIKKNLMYRNILVKKNLIKPDNEIYLDYNEILEQELEKIQKETTTSVLVAISPDDKNKYLIKPEQIETIILNNIRQNDLLMNYAANKYFLLLYNIDIDNAQRVWTKISTQFPVKIYAGFAQIFSKTRQQLVNEALNKLHESINYNKAYTNLKTENSKNKNFKLFRQELNKKLEQITIPVFYHIKQKYSEKLFGIVLKQENGNGYCSLELSGYNSSALFKLTTPGFSNINIDITYNMTANHKDARRIILTPEEFESGLLEDLLEQFIIEFKKEANNGIT